MGDFIKSISWKSMRAVDEKLEIKLLWSYTPILDFFFEINVGIKQPVVGIVVWKLDLTLGSQFPIQFLPILGISMLTLDLSLFTTRNPSQDLANHNDGEYSPFLGCVSS